MTDEHIKEASWVVQSVTGASAYLHGVDYDSHTFKQELQSMIDHVKQPAGAGRK